MNVHFLGYSHTIFDDKVSLEDIREILVNEMERLPESEVKFEIVTKSFLNIKDKLFQGRLVTTFKSHSFKWLCNQSEGIFNLPNRIEKIWMMLQILSCCTTFELDRPLVEFKEFSPIINPFLILASRDEDSTLRQLPNDILRVIAKIILVWDLKDNANAFVNSVKEARDGYFSLDYWLRTS